MTDSASSNLSVLLHNMQPLLNQGVFVYTTVTHSSNLSQYTYIASFRETESITLIMAEEQALKAGLPILFRAAWITLSVHSDLQAVGLTAAVAGSLADAGISCNVVAATYHDHIFVPLADAQQAMQCLWELQNTG